MNIERLSSTSDIRINENKVAVVTFLRSVDGCQLAVFHRTADANFLQTGPVSECIQFRDLPSADCATLQYLSTDPALLASVFRRGVAEELVWPSSLRLGNWEYLGAYSSPHKHYLVGFINVPIAGADYPQIDSANPDEVAYAYWVKEARFWTSFNGTTPSKRDPLKVPTFQDMYEERFGPIES